jgi:endonuclease YncB( thermonuclease family)
MEIMILGCWSDKAGRSGFLVLGLVFAVGCAVGASLGTATFHHMLSAAVSPPSAYGPPMLLTARGSYATEVLRVIDGDTFEARVHVWPGIVVTTKVRLRGLDAPERRGRCQAEFLKAEAARDALAALLAAGGVTIASVSLDKYGGRVLADVASAHAPDVAAALLSSGHARPHAGGRRLSWC